MGKVPVDLRYNIAANIRHCRSNRYPMWGGAKKCAEDFGVSPQQWSQWERGKHMPDEYRMIEIAAFFGVSTEFLRRDNTLPEIAQPDARKSIQGFRAVRIDNGVEVPLHVEVERVLHHGGYGGYTMKMERVL